MDGTFHRFSDFPWELRDMIWNFALRPSVPGVHIFKLYNSKTDDGVHKNIDVFNPYDHITLRLAVPQSNKSSITRNRNNPSTYLIDGGLWTACKESRLVMKRKFNCHKWKSSLENGILLRSEIIETRMDMAETSYFACHNGHTHFFTVFPHRDIFILRPQNLETIDWSEFHWDIELGSYRRGFGGFQNIALEYNPEWGYDIEDKIVDMAMNAGFHSSGLSIWIVDYTLRRRDSAAVGQKTTSHGDESVAFHLNGRRLIPVNTYRDREEGWIEIEKVNGKYIERVSGRVGFSSIDLVNRVRDEIWELCDRYEV
ncbi:2EXR domain-containing protein [Fusarium falciforme]|uniref:2EXR domain-containing protein n=1 Tax=Fusarium falciforme TaxID=195108 RepID=UPI00230093E8|nr:2EXR domain-containing protein [Fusarium falciforme]WAO94851.1 2EXR domain-containing protein [Fusarium falciforme]